MKLLTLNTHSLAEENYSEKAKAFISEVTEIKPDIIALQEANQSINETPLSQKPQGYIACYENTVLHKDNHIYNISEMLRKKGVDYYWTWLPLKKSYDRFTEGIGIMSRNRIIETAVHGVSGIDDYNNWKTRKIVGIRSGTMPDQWFFSVHYGWWNDIDEPFHKQWQKTAGYMKKYDKVWLMGDFNNPAHIRNEGYDLIESDGWYDSYGLAQVKDSGITVKGQIDGWRDNNDSAGGMRIDQIWCNYKAEVLSSQVIFNGVNEPVVSDHYGVMVKL